MWPFCRESAAESKSDQVRVCIEELRAFRGIGDKFYYLGATVIVTGHSRLAPSGLGLHLVPELIGDYKTDNGEVHPISFSYRELPALIAENATFSGSAQEIEELKAKLNPRQWTQEMHDAWHTNLPDMQSAFDALRKLDR